MGLGRRICSYAEAVMLMEDATASGEKPGLSTPHPFQVEAIVPEWVDVGRQQRRGADQVLARDRTTLRAELPDDFADS